MKKQEEKVLTEKVFIQTIRELREVFATKEDLKNELKRFATKEDLERFATKEDLREELKAYATKEDLERFATKEELKRFATKKDLEDMQNSLLDAIEGTDSFTRKKLSDHEKRITALETSKN